MANATFTISIDTLRPKLLRLQKLGKDTTPVMRAMGTTFKGITERNFTASGAMRPIAWVAKKDGTPATLRQSGLLWHSFTLGITPKTATLTNPTPYATRHQFGDEDYQAGETTGRVKTKYANKDFEGSWSEVRSGSKGMPPRPFVPVKDGVLTPAAAELILRAGQRAVDRALK